MKLYELNKTKNCCKDISYIFYVVYTYANYYLPCLYDINTGFSNYYPNKSKVMRFRVL